MPPKSTAGALKAPAKAAASSGAPAASKAAATSSASSSKLGDAKTSKTASAIKPASTTKAAASSSKASAKPAATSTKATAAKSPAKKAATGAASTQPAPAAYTEPPALTEEELQARLHEALAKALAETEEARKAAWQQQLEADRRKEAARRKKAEEEAKRKKEEARLKKACLEAAYDDEDDQLRSLLAEAQSKGIKNAVEMADSHGNTLLSEAAAGGAAKTLEVLLTQHHANPNSQGEFARTPLWRAAFLGHAHLITPLLEAGADPRIGNEQGETPAHVATKPEIKDVLTAWDTTRTEHLVAQWQDKQQKQKESALAACKAAVQSAQDIADEAEAEHAKCQQALRFARQELEKRISEYDFCVAEEKPDDITKVALDLIHSQEEAVSQAVTAAHKASEALDGARLALREQQAAERTAAGHGHGSDDHDGEEPLPGTLVEIKALDEVLVRDVGGKLAASGRWPLLIDTSGQASVFLRYMDTNYVNALSPHDMEPDRLRRSILGGLRFGKPVVLDLMDVASLWSEMPSAFDRIMPGLLQSLLDKSLVKNDMYLKLIKPTDGEDYDPTRFQDARVAKFSFIIHTSTTRPPHELLEHTTPLRVNNRG